MGIRSFNVADLGQVGLLNPTKMGYRDSLEIIKDESFKIQKSFVKIGWYLKHIRDDELYKADGYENIYACAADQLGYAQSTVSRLINICEKFSKDHNSPELDEKYSGFDKSQMIEMLPMSSEQLEKVTPDMTVKQIREVNKETKAVKEPNDKVKRVNELVPVQEEQEEKYMPEDYSNSTEQQNTNNDYATSHKTEENIVDVVYKELPEKVSAYGLSKSVYPEESLIATEGCGNKHTCFSCAKKCEIREVERYCVEAPMGIPFSCNTMNNIDLLEDEMGDKCQFVNQETAWHRPGDHEPAPCCKECSITDCGYRCNRSFIVSDPKEEISVVKYILDQEQKNLDEILEVNKEDNSPAIPEMTVLKKKIIVQALTNMFCDMKHIDTETEKSVQPDLPTFKNNDQRKEWLANYKDWGLWYRDEKIDVNYYKYDFSEGSRLVVAEYPQRQHYWEKNKMKDEYYYHLIQVEKEGKYRNSTDSGTYLVDFLKNLQRKG